MNLDLLSRETKEYINLVELVGKQTKLHCDDGKLKGFCPVCDGIPAILTIDPISDMCSCDGECSLPQDADIFDYYSGLHGVNRATAIMALLAYIGLTE